MLLFHLSYANYSILGIFRRQKKRKLRTEKEPFQNMECYKSQIYEELKNFYQKSI